MWSRRAARRHPADRRHPDHRRPVVGEVADLLGPQHQQEGPDARHLQSDAGRELLMRLIATCDVIVENFTPRVLDQIGLDFAAVQAVRPDAIMLRMPGFGLDGPWRDNPAFAYVIEEASGISWLTGYPDRNPYEPYSVGDPNAGVHALNALLLALEHRRRTGRRRATSRRRWSTPRSTSPPNRSSSTRRTARCCNAPGTAARRRRRKTCTAPARSTSSVGATVGWPSPSPPTSSGRDCVTRSAGPDWATEPALATRDGRRRHHDLIDEHLSRVVCGAHRRRDRRALWEAGVPVAKVMQPHRQSELPQLAPAVSSRTSTIR